MIFSELKDNNNISKITNYLGISRSSIYYKKRTNITRSRISKELEDQIIDLSKERVTYGYRRIWALLRNSGIRINAKTVYRVMKSHALTLKKYEHKNRKSRKDLTKPREPNKLWEMDITYISTKREGMLYLFNVKDCFTKEWIEYLLSRTCNRRDAVRALEQAYLRVF
ncbi:MAG: IS3 family transposase, partial [Thermoplasmata archaeon]